MHKWWRSGQIAAHLEKESAPLRTLPVGVEGAERDLYRLPFSLGYVRKVERASTVDVFGRVNLKTLDIPEGSVCF